MADITKCTGILTTAQDGIVGKCEKRESCYRYTAKANQHRQSYFCEAPVKWVEPKGVITQDSTPLTTNKRQVCDHYWPTY